MSHQTFLLSRGDVRAEVVPERGALVTRLTVSGRELLFMDHDTLADRSKNVRGGVPLLFPFAGRLDGDRFLPAGTSMKQHGFARNLAFTPALQQRDDVLEMRLAASDETRAVYPYEFVATQTVRLTGRGLQIELVVENRGHAPLPVSPGWHPYFPCPSGQKRELRLEGVAVPPGAIADDREFDFGVPGGSGRVRAQVPGIGGLELDFSPRMRHLQLWSLPERSFVCIEPFWGPAGTVNGPARDEIAPDAAHDYWMRVELAP